VTAADDDHHLASDLARQAGALLLQLRDDAIEESGGGYHHASQLRWDGDRQAHLFLTAALARLRPDDAVLSEEGRDNSERLTAERLWIVDPLDGSNDYPNPASGEWAVHVALVENGRPTAGAVSVPARNQLYSTLMCPTTQSTPREQPLILSGRSAVRAARLVANQLGGQVATCGSAGVKAMAVVAGTADAYVHGGWMYEWDSCAPEVVAQAAGLHVSNLEGDEIEYNKPFPEIAGFLVSRPEIADDVLAALSTAL